MILDVGREVAALGRLTAGQLRARYAEVFGEPTNGHNKTWLVRRIAWRMQALAEGDLSERARRRAEELAQGAELRTTIPASRLAAGPTAPITALPSNGDGRLPPPGTVITRPYKGGVVQVLVLPHGFEYAGSVYGSLSAVAKAVTGSHCNGYLFFRLTGRGAR